MNKSEIIALCERVQQNPDFNDFCAYLVDCHKEDIFASMISSKPNMSKITAEDYAASKIYANLSHLPNRIIKKLSKKEEQNIEDVY